MPTGASACATSTICPTGCCASWPGGPRAHAAAAKLPHDTMLVARTMGPAELLDYDRTRLRGLVLEDRAARAMSPSSPRRWASPPSARRAASWSASTRAIRSSSTPRPARCTSAPRARSSPPMPTRPASAPAGSASTAPCATRPAVTKDGQRIELHINAGLLVDMPHLAESGADGIGLFRTELQFMLSATLPRLERQTQMYRAVVAEAGEQAGRLPHARCRRRQGAALPAPAAGGEPGARLARHPPGARPARPAAHAGARAAAGDRRRRSCGCCCRW